MMDRTLQATAAQMPPQHFRDDASAAAWMVRGGRAIQSTFAATPSFCLAINKIPGWCVELSEEEQKGHETEINTDGTTGLASVLAVPWPLPSRLAHADDAMRRVCARVRSYLPPPRHHDDDDMDHDQAGRHQTMINLYANSARCGMYAHDDHSTVTMLCVPSLWRLPSHAVEGMC